LIALIEQHDLDKYDGSNVMQANKLVDFVIDAYLNGWGYVLSGQGELYTPELAEKWVTERKIYGTRKYFTQDCARWFNHRVADCSGLIVCAFRTLWDPKYQDQVADTFRNRFKESGPIKTLPDVPGVALWRPGHIGVYIGNGYAIEARGWKYGVVQTRVKDRTWTHWGKLADIEYEGDDYMIRKGMKGQAVKDWQSSLLAVGIGLPRFGADGDFGSETEAGTKAFQKAGGLKQTGVVDATTAGEMFMALMEKQGDTAKVKELEKTVQRMKAGLASIEQIAVNARQ
jgi:hypothetical protein